MKQQQHSTKNTQGEEQQEAEKDLLTVAEVSQILRVDGTTVRRWVKQGVLEAVVLPHLNERSAYRIKRETLEKVIAGTQMIPRG